MLVLLLEFVFELCLPDYLLIFDDLPLESVLVAGVALLQLLDVLLLEDHPDLALDLAHEVFIRVRGAVCVPLFWLGMGI